MSYEDAVADLVRGTGAEHLGDAARHLVASLAASRVEAAESSRPVDRRAATVKVLAAPTTANLFTRRELESLSDRTLSQLGTMAGRDLDELGDAFAHGEEHAPLPVDSYLVSRAKQEARDAAYEATRRAPEPERQRPTTRSAAVDDGSPPDPYNLAGLRDGSDNPYQRRNHR